MAKDAHHDLIVVAAIEEKVVPETALDRESGLLVGADCADVPGKYRQRHAVQVAGMEEVAQQRNHRVGAVTLAPSGMIADKDHHLRRAGLGAEPLEVHPTDGGAVDQVDGKVAGVVEAAEASGEILCEPLTDDRAARHPPELHQFWVIKPGPEQRQVPFIEGTETYRSPGDHERSRPLLSVADPHA
ncbi:MAG: hypothetical protein M3Q03_13340 [Chloroflexota bacterium]|nr:hypothetical protein [Chloroflexota bacterium]